MFDSPIVTELEVDGLFGYLSHKIAFRSDDPTILTGLNGAGKTHVLQTLRSLTRCDVLSLSLIPITSASLTYSSGARVFAKRTTLEGGVVVALSWFDLLGIEIDQLEVAIPGPDEYQRSMPPWLHRVGDRYRDERTGELLTYAAVKQMLARHESILPTETRRNLEAFRTKAPKMGSFSIDTRRLDTAPSGEEESWRNRADRTRRGGRSRIELYLQRLTAQMEAARDDAVRSSQEADISFAERALAAASKTVNETKLRARYNAVVAQYNDLAGNGLTVLDAPIPFPNKTTPTVRRILDPFVEDWEKRLAPLIPLNHKINLFRELLDARLQSSFKRTAAHARGIDITDVHGRKLDVNKLSSGEQHLLALYTRLLFDTRPGSLVLIDEPEISLHPAWQHAFVRDIDRVADLVPMQIVIATHSPSIVNERWDLEEVLKITPPPGPDSKAALDDFDTVEAAGDDDLDE